MFLPRQRPIIDVYLLPMHHQLTGDERRDRERGEETDMPYEDEAISLLTKMRQAELRAEVEHERSAQQKAALVPTISEHMVAAARVLGHVWRERLAWARVLDGRCSERSSGSSWRQVVGAQRGCWEPWRSLSAQRRHPTVVR